MNPGRVVAALAIAFLALAPPAAYGESSAPSKHLYVKDGPGGRYLLGGKWLFKLDPTDEGLAQGWQNDPSLTGWQSVSIPHSWNATDESQASLDGTVGWYRKRFRLPKDELADTAKSWAFRFQSVNYRATAWLNGKPIGSHAKAYLDFELPAKGVKKNGLNDLVVRVDNRKGTGDLPGNNDVGWWNYGGIVREVYLRRLGNLDARKVSVQPDLKCAKCPGRLTVSMILENDGKRARGDIRGEITGPGGFRRALDFGRKPVPKKGVKSYEDTVVIKDPKLWDPDHPNLYVVRLRIGPGAQPDQTYTVHTGVRSFRKGANGALLLNGKPLQLRGASMHEDSPNNGDALSPSQRKSYVKLLEELHADFARSHYPLHPEFYEAFDRLGIVAWNEIPVYQTTAELIKNSAFQAQALRMLQENIEENGNHPSIMTWSIANELSSEPGGGQKRYVHRAVQLAHSLDPTRFVGQAIAGYPTVGPQMTYKQLDMLGINDYFGWYKGPQDSIVDRNALAPYLDQLHAYYPDLGFAVTEIGAEAAADGPAEQRGTYAFQSDFLNFHMGVIATKPWISAASIWILRDFRVKPAWVGGNDPAFLRGPWNQKGVVNMTGQKKPAFYTLAGTYKATPWHRG